MSTSSQVQYIKKNPQAAHGDCEGWDAPTCDPGDGSGGDGPTCDAGVWVCFEHHLLITLSIPNCKSFQKSWRVKAFSRLT